MMRTRIFVGLTLLAVGALGLAGCKPNIPITHPTAEILAMEQDALDAINSERAGAGLDPLVMDEDLREVARAHSEDMVARDFFSHTNPDGRDPFERMDAAGISYVSAGENIAMNNTATPLATAIAGWMASPPHRANILRPQFNFTGMGVATDGAGGYYFTQDFVGTVAKSGEEPVFDYSEPLATTQE